MGHASFPSALRPVIISNLCVKVSMEAKKGLNVVTVHPLFKALAPAPSAPLIIGGGAAGSVSLQPLLAVWRWGSHMEQGGGGR